MTTDDCRNDKIRKSEFYLDTFAIIKNIFLFENSVYLNKSVQDSYFDLNKEHIDIMKKLGSLENDFYTCTRECIKIS